MTKRFVNKNLETLIFVFCTVSMFQQINNIVKLDNFLKNYSIHLCLKNKLVLSVFSGIKL